jgi:death-on-curing protein
VNWPGCKGNNAEGRSQAQSLLFFVRYFTVSIHYLTKEELLDLHVYAVSRFGGQMGIASQDRLHNVLNAPRQEMFGAELYGDVCSKAAVMIYLLLKSHPFVGGNEVTALMALLRFLALNGVSLKPDIGDGDLIWLFASLQQARLDKEGLEQWLREAT